MHKAVIGGPTDPASVGSLSWPSMLSGISHFFFISAISVVLLCDFVETHYQKCLILLNARVFVPVKGVKTSTHRNRKKRRKKQSKKKYNS